MAVLDAAATPKNRLNASAPDRGLSVPRSAWIRYLKIQPPTAEYPMAGAGEPAAGRRPSASAGPFPAEALGGCRADGKADTSQDEPPSGSPEIPLCAVRHLILSHSFLSVWQARGTGAQGRNRPADAGAPQNGQKNTRVSRHPGNFTAVYLLLTVTQSSSLQKIRSSISIFTLFIA